jgi:hypothetical protein
MNGLVRILIRYIHSAAIAGARLLGTSRLRTLVTGSGVGSFVFFAAAMMANAQFKVVGPAPYSPTVAREKIRALLEGIDPSNSQKTIATLSGLLSWYRNILDEEMIAAWQKDTRANVTEAIQSLADSRAASAIVEFSWRERRQTAFNLAYAPMLGNLMARFPESAKPFLDDLLPVSSSKQSPDLSQPEAEAVCRILMDMPDIGTWRKSALQILPRYRRACESLLVQDLHGSDQEKVYQALRWQADLKLDVPGNGNEQPSPRRRSTPSLSSAQGGIPPDNEQPRPRRRTTPSLSSAPGGIASVNTVQTEDNQTESAVSLPRASDDRPPAPAATRSEPAPPPPHPAASVPSPPQPSPLPPSPLPPYSGAKTGTLESTGGPIAQNAEYVFRNLPLVKMQLDYDTKIWEARLVPGEGQTQRLIIRNKSSGPQKRCVVRWSVIP